MATDTSPAPEAETRITDGVSTDLIDKAHTDTDQIGSDAESVLRHAQLKATRVKAEAEVHAAQLVSLAEQKASDIITNAQADATTRAQEHLAAALKAAEETAEQLRNQARRQAAELLADAERHADGLREAAESALLNARDEARQLLGAAEGQAAEMVASAERQAQLTDDVEALVTWVRSETDSIVELRAGLDAQATSPKTLGAAKVPLTLSSGEIWIFLAVIATSALVGVLGLYSSFDSVAVQGARWGFGGGIGPLPDGWVLPCGIDLAIPAFTGANLLLIRTDMPLAWVRFVPWVLSGVTCYLNTAAAGASSVLAARIAHGVMPALWVVLSEVAAHAYATHIGAVTGKRMDKIRFSRWVLAFPSTFMLWRRMVLWEVTSYLQALATERDRRRHCDRLREQHGRWWRWKAPRSERFLALPLGGEDDSLREANGSQGDANAALRTRGSESEDGAQANAVRAAKASEANGEGSASAFAANEGREANEDPRSRTNAANEPWASEANAAGGGGVSPSGPKLKKPQGAAVRDKATARFRQSQANGKPLTGAQLGEEFGMSARWGQLLVAEITGGRRSAQEREAKPRGADEG